MSRPSGRAILIGASVVVVIATLSGIAVIGSPAAERVEQLDASRVRDLQGIMAAADLYWARNDRLPESLAELDQDPRTAVNTADPASGVPYEYRPQGGDAYELCATFDGESTDPSSRAEAEFWRHGAGRVCFDLTVDSTAGVRP